MISIVIATRDRPDLLARALRSVAAQRGIDHEVLLVDDSTSAEARERNAAALAQLVPGGVVVPVTGVAGGLGPGEARNRGMAPARFPLIAFLDDDDEWIDPDHLARAAAAMMGQGLDLLFADQVAVQPDGSVVAGPVWAEDLREKLPARGAVAIDGVFRLDPAQVLLSDGFAHLNTTVIRRGLGWDTLGGFDPAIRYEEDRDFFLRAIDVAEAIGYAPLVVARHYVPQARASASSIAVAQKEACRLQVLNKAADGAARAVVRARGRRDRGYLLQRMSARAADEGRWDEALAHRRAALRDRFGAKGVAALALLYFRKAMARRSQAG